MARILWIVSTISFLLVGCMGDSFHDLNLVFTVNGGTEEEAAKIEELMMDDLFADTFSQSLEDNINATGDPTVIIEEIPQQNVFRVGSRQKCGVGFAPENTLDLVCGTDLVVDPEQDCAELCQQEDDEVCCVVPELCSVGFNVNSGRDFGCPAGETAVKDLRCAELHCVEGEKTTCCEGAHQCRGYNACQDARFEKDMRLHKLDEYCADNVCTDQQCCIARTCSTAFQTYSDLCDNAFQRSLDILIGDETDEAELRDLCCAGAWCKAPSGGLAVAAETCLMFTDRIVSDDLFMLYEDGSVLQNDGNASYYQLPGPKDVALGDQVQTRQSARRGLGSTDGPRGSEGYSIGKRSLGESKQGVCQADGVTCHSLCATAEGGVAKPGGECVRVKTDEDNVQVQVQGRCAANRYMCLSGCRDESGAVVPPDHVCLIPQISSVATPTTGVCLANGATCKLNCRQFLGKPGNEEFCSFRGYVDNVTAGCKKFPCELSECCRPTCGLTDQKIPNFCDGEMFDEASSKVCAGEFCTERECCKPQKCGEALAEVNFCNTAGVAVDTAKTDAVCATPHCSLTECCKPSTCTASLHASPAMCELQNGEVDIGKEQFQCAHAPCIAAECCKLKCFPGICEMGSKQPKTDKKGKVIENLFCKTAKTCVVWGNDEDCCESFVEPREIFISKVEVYPQSLFLLSLWI